MENIRWHRRVKINFSDGQPLDLSKYRTRDDAPFELNPKESIIVSIPEAPEGWELDAVGLNYETLEQYVRFRKPAAKEAS